MKKVTWNDLHEASQTDLKSTYKLNDRELEKGLRKHLDGANAKERREVYDQFYRRKS